MLEIFTRVFINMVAFLRVNRLDLVQLIALSLLIWNGSHSQAANDRWKQPSSGSYYDWSKWTITPPGNTSLPHTRGGVFDVGGAYTVSFAQGLPIDAEDNVNTDINIRSGDIIFDLGRTTLTGPGHRLGIRVGEFDRQLPPTFLIDNGAINAAIAAGNGSSVTIGENITGGNLFLSANSSYASVLRGAKLSDLGAYLTDSHFAIAASGPFNNFILQLLAIAGPSSANIEGVTSRGGTFDASSSTTGAFAATTAINNSDLVFSQLLMGANATFDLSASKLVVGHPSLRVGIDLARNAIFRAENSANIQTTDVAIGSDTFLAAGISPTLVLSGNTTKLTVTGVREFAGTPSSLRVGYQGIGRLRVEDGAKLESIDAWIGTHPVGEEFFPYGDGTVEIIGGRSSWSNQHELGVGLGSNGKLIIQDGLVQTKRLLMANHNPFDRMADAPNKPMGTVELKGSGSPAELHVHEDLLMGGDDFESHHGTADLHVRDGWVFVGQKIKVWEGAKIKLELNTKLEIGTEHIVPNRDRYQLRVLGNSNGSPGVLHLAGGSVSANGVLVRGTLQGHGFLDMPDDERYLNPEYSYGLQNNGRIVVSGDYHPAEVSIGPLSTEAQLWVQGDYFQASNAELELTLTPDNEITVFGPTRFPMVITGENLGFGGTLRVNRHGITPAVGDRFNLISFERTPQGNFSSLQLPTLAPGLAWNTSQLYSTGEISVASASAGVPGDYNNNGTVDAADYVLWRRGGQLANEVDTPGTVNAGDYDAWRARFGNTAGSGAAVPEPAAVLLAFAATLCHGCRRNRAFGTAPFAAHAL